MRNINWKNVKFSAVLSRNIIILQTIRFKVLDQTLFFCIEIYQGHFVVTIRPLLSSFGPK